MVETATHRVAAVSMYKREPLTALNRLLNSKLGLTGTVFLSSRCLSAALLFRMSQNKMLQISIVVVFFLQSWLDVLVLGELDPDFSQCLGFFYNSTPPTDMNLTEYQPICQRYKNQYRFASLYDRRHRAPLYSAYILRPADGKRPNASWKFEPQVGTNASIMFHSY